MCVPIPGSGIFVCVIRPSLSVGPSWYRGAQRTGHLITPLHLVLRYVMLTVVNPPVCLAPSWLVAE